MLATTGTQGPEAETLREYEARIPKVLLVFELGSAGLIGLLCGLCSCEPSYTALPIVESHTAFLPEAVAAAHTVKVGIDQLVVRNDSIYILADGFDIGTKKPDPMGFLTGLACISPYQALGDSAFLNIAVRTADALGRLLPSTGLVPGILFEQVLVTDTTAVVLCADQANVLAMVAQLAKIDGAFVPLVRALADGLIRHGIDPRTGLVRHALVCGTGAEYSSPGLCEETLLGSDCCFSAQALVSAAEVTQDTLYKAMAVGILRSIWQRRDRRTDLISETWDIARDTIGTCHYPYVGFRYDDMGGAYIRALMAVMDGDDTSAELGGILEVYTKALVEGVWDERIAGGGFRYLTYPENGTGAPQLETMYGLFIATLLRSLPYFDDASLRQEIVDKCSAHAQHVFLTEYGVKHHMVPHNVAEGGNYTTEQNDSQLGYAVLQFPLGMGMLSHFTSDTRYSSLCRQVIDTMLLRHAIASPEVPSGFIGIVETYPPFRPETTYRHESWCREFLFLPAYVLYASIRPSQDVRLDWGHDNGPNVYGLVTGMPFWDQKKLHLDYKRKTLQCVALASTTDGHINFDDLGFSGIASVHCDGSPIQSFTGNMLRTKEGRHVYEVRFT